MKRKDLIIGIVLVAASISAGIIGYAVVVLLTQDNTEDVFIPGLPDDFEGAPIGANIIISNGTDTMTISFGDILEGVELWMEQEVTGLQINEEKDIVALHAYDDKEIGKRITGVDILDILEMSGMNFAWNLVFSSTNDGETKALSRTTGNIIDDAAGSYRPTFIALAINKKWIKDTAYAGEWGNFTVVGRNLSEKLFDLQQINIMSEWNVDIIINGVKSPFSINTTNMWYNAVCHNYSYYRSDYWNFNRSYIGRTIDDIVKNATYGMGFTDWNVSFACADGLVDPNPPYNKSEIENGMANDGSLTIPRNNDDKVNITGGGTGVGLPITNQKMVLVFRLMQYVEGNAATNSWDPAWENYHYCGYRHGPFTIYVPGRTRSNFPKYITQIIIEAS
ncbi:MAG: hypothetical protein JW891_12525 [Candidatus Lokiarchaeota archaeon]|nr:hypothetical protein [Candidatus Lokiarchaeota archaeon]